MVLLICLIPHIVSADKIYQTLPTTSKVIVDGRVITFKAFNINGNNYFKLRDLAKAVNGSDKQFEVVWDGSNNAINLTSKTPYTVVGGELVSNGFEEAKATLSSTRVFVDNQLQYLTAYNINGNEYFKIREIGQIFDFCVGWNVAENTIAIDTTLGYKTVSTGIVKVTFIDVGQGDSELIQFPNGKTMLIDGGSGNMYSRVAAILAENNITMLNVVIGTHTDDDHIGSLPGIIKNYEVGSVFLNGISDSRTYQAFVRESLNKGLIIKHLYQGDTLEIDPSVKIRVFSPKGINVETDNGNSPIMKLTYNNRSFLFLGDAEKVSEDIALNYDKKGLKSDVVKVGHHGSTTSSSPAFAYAISPALAIIEVGTDNSYGHPDEIVVNRWQLLGAKVYSTAKNGTVTIKTDGNSLELFANKSTKPLIKALSTDNSTFNTTIQNQLPVKTIEAFYIGNKNTKVFHFPDCRSVDQMNVSNKVLIYSRQMAIVESYKPCNVCNP